MFENQASEGFLQSADGGDVADDRTVLGLLLALEMCKGALRAPPETIHEEGQVEEVDDVAGLTWPWR